MLVLAHRARAEVATLPWRRRLHSLPAGIAEFESTLREAAMLPARGLRAPCRAVPSSSWLWRAREGMVGGAAGTTHKRPQQVAAGRAGRRDESGKTARARSVTERQEINFQVPDAVFDKSWALGFRLGPPDVPPMPDCDPTFPSGLRLEAHVGSLPAKPAVCYYYKWGPGNTGGGQGLFP